MRKEYKNVIEKVLIGLISTLLVIGLFYYVLFHGFIHVWIVRVWKMIQLIIN